MKEYKELWRRGFEFSGVSTRKEYWMVWLINICIFSVLSIGSKITSNDIIALIFALTLLLYVLFAAIPSIAITVRRLHDSNKSGAWFFIMFVPYLGQLVILVFMCLDTVEQGNNYGYHGYCDNK